ncbi:YeeE/YedE family protein [Sphingomicrobium astaxanthinifaciens]|uniref:YeeE/YedE family protein n=1 Tax=Sphingomicrobium astaxanthinifaciens TaxID=1227949 RepID=UPI001FCB34EE|nr:YeeE/YedE thiosulfate transporter family protein [Sphingomicrobium astaxanthinifaciens]MCJ7420590.1 YeeE/YedE family protein [Sphingomicrobium astaxanthinifaciens]
MTIPGFEHAQPLEGLVGGLMIGLAAAIMLLGIGRIAGVSGLTARATGIADSGPPRSLAVTFVIALVAGAVLVELVTGTIEARFPPELWMLVAAGLCVGFGTRMGSGCTSGHGVCGMSRLSQRSISATLTFMGAGIATVAVMNALGKGW